MGFFKKMGKLAKKRFSFKNIVKMANPLNALNPAFHLKQIKGDLKDAHSLIKNDSPRNTGVHHSNNNHSNKGNHHNDCHCPPKRPTWLNRF